MAEIFATRCSAEQQKAEAERVHAAAETLAGAGSSVRYLRSLFVPGEETAFHLFEAERPSDVEDALRDVDLEAERISPAIEVAGRRHRRLLPLTTWTGRRRR